MSALRQLSLFIRKRLPDRFRFALRLAHHVFHRGQPSQPLTPQLVADCRVCASRRELLKSLPHGGIIVEVGTHRGDFAEQILEICNPSELWLVDLDFAFLKPTVRNDARVKTRPGYSDKALASFPDVHFDWIYIDADHSYEAVMRDARVAAAKVKPGGYLVFNDFAHVDPYLGAYGVHRAVIDFATEQEWGFAWFAFEPNALYDVALRRPG